MSDWMYEDELPADLSAEQYSEWYAASKVIDGVRMGPRWAMFDAPPDLDERLKVVCSPKVIPINCTTKLDVPVEKVLQGAEDANLTDVVIVGYREDGSEYFASSAADGGTVLWLLERAKLRLLRVVDKESEDD